MSLLDAALGGLALLALAALAHPRVARARLWRASATPLASIIGSGFLVLGPILAAEYGAWAPAAMAALCLVAWGFGSAIRYSIAEIERAGPGARRDPMEELAELALAGAYFVSVAYYLNLFGAFALSLTSLGEPWPRVLTSAVLLGILALGWLRGFGALERVEMLTVAVKLAVIAGLIAGLIAHFHGQALGGALILPERATGGWAAVTLGFGLIVTVQGFETSRYLGAEYSAAERIRSMRIAQIVSAAIYLIYVGLLTYSLAAPSREALTETAVIDMMTAVAPVLPAMLLVAALSAQLSAAVADANGAGGLLRELTGGRISPRLGYVVLALAALALTWAADVFEIISYASRAFAIYYAAQALIAARYARRRGDRRREAAFAALAILGLAIAVFGRAVEGGG